ncbi:MAG: SDR family oxidoreductase [Bacteroidetes bacterium]|nr:SDR family oxidoreductase [Bacteroidota bacterium]
MNNISSKNYWALILGGSSGFGLATARKLAEEGFNICIVHRDRRGAMEAIDQAFEKIRSKGIQFVSYNVNALTADGQAAVINSLNEILSGNGKIRLVLHSIAFGNLKPLSPVTEKTYLRDEDFSGTIYAMGTSLISWIQKLLKENMLAEDSRVIALTSEGSSIAWSFYAAVSAAKAALEAICRSMALELAPYGIKTNVIQAGVTDTAALRFIPGHEKIKALAITRNPFHRLTTTEDVADVIFLLCTDNARWINGSIIKVDGGESISGVH